MLIQVNLFARFKDLAGADQITVDLPNNATVRDLRQTLKRIYPSSAGLLERSAVAVDNEFTEDRTAILANAEVALLPPVSGG
ncbi:MAG: MoaD/ThiS family protein [Gemmataceae bacterium]